MKNMDLNNEISQTVFEPRVFVSHSSADNEFGLSLVNDLRKRIGSEEAVWYDSHGGLWAGDDWWERICHEIDSRNVFLIVLSPDAMESQWVKTEMRMAWERLHSKDPQRRMVVIPILKRPCDVPKYLTTVQFVSFTEFRSYDEALSTLMQSIYSGYTRFIESPVKHMGPPSDSDLLSVPDHFVGRGKDIAWMLQHLDPKSTTSVVAVNGLGGMGKTSLAAIVLGQIQKEERFPDGIVLVDCRDVTQPTQVLQRVLGRFDDERIQPANTDINELADLVRKHLYGMRALVVIDNVSHDLAVHLTPIVTVLRNAGLKQLLLSRELLPLSVAPVEATRKLEPLSNDEALDLLTQSMGLAPSDLSELDQDAGARIVHSLGNHTLAVKLAGGYIAEQARSLKTYAEELESNPQRALILENGQEAVRTVLESSVRSLPPISQRIFAALAVFSAPDFGRNAAIYLASALKISDADAVWSIEQLVRQRLLNSTMVSALPETCDKERLQIHLLVKAFAASMLLEWPEPEQSAAYEALAHYFVAYVGVPVRGRDALPMAVLATDEKNITGVLDWTLKHEPKVAVQICLGMQYFWCGGISATSGSRYLDAGTHAAWTLFLRTGEENDELCAVRLTRARNVSMLAMPPNFIGRSQEVGELTALLQEHKQALLLGVHGMAGIGKTAVVAAVLRNVLAADLFLDGIAVVRCWSLSDDGGEEYLLRAVARELDPLTIYSSLDELLTGKNVMVVLDDLQSGSQLWGAVARLRALGVTLIITSRGDLSTDRSSDILESMTAVRMSLPDLAASMRLFDQILLSTRGSGLQPSEFVDAKRIHDLLGGHPLALDIAARLALQKGGLASLADEIEKGGL